MPTIEVRSTYSPRRADKHGSLRLRVSSVYNRVRDSSRFMSVAMLACSSFYVRG